MDSNRCLWCNSPTRAEPFCRGGGSVRFGRAKTGEPDGVTKSYCYADFLSILGLSQVMNRLSEAEKEYVLHEEDIKVWYKSIPFQPYREEQKVMVPKVA